MAGVACVAGYCMAGGACIQGGMHSMHTPPADTMRYGQCAGGTHPTEMHSCLYKFQKILEKKKNCTKYSFHSTVNMK